MSHTQEIDLRAINDPDAATIKPVARDARGKSLYIKQSCHRMMSNGKSAPVNLMLNHHFLMLVKGPKMTVNRVMHIHSLEHVFIQEEQGGCIVVFTFDRAVQRSMRHIEPMWRMRMPGSKDAVLRSVVLPAWKQWKRFKGDSPNLKCYTVTPRAQLDTEVQQFENGQQRFAKEKQSYKSAKEKHRIWKESLPSVKPPPAPPKPDTPPPTPPPPPPPPPVIEEKVVEEVPEPEVVSEVTESESSYEEPQYVPVVEHVPPVPEYISPPPQEPRMLMPADMIDTLRQPAPVVRRKRKVKALPGAPSPAKPAQNVYLHLYMHRPAYGRSAAMEVDNDLPIASPVAFYPHSSPAQYGQTQASQQASPYTYGRY